MTIAAMVDFARHSLPAVVNHLWQSTLYLLGASLLAIALSKQPARIRYAVWLSATLKFLVPFSAFTSLGQWLARFRQTAEHQVDFTTVVLYVGRPFATPAQIASTATGVAWLPSMVCLLWLGGSAVLLAHYLHRWKIVRAASMTATHLHAGREVDALQSAAQLAAATRPIPLLLSSATLEPGIVGIRKPSLLWPVGITEHLDDAQLGTIMLHEAWHVRRRDNLTSMLQMIVEIIFWFHPLVWWLGSRLISERERACDESVLQCGIDPRVYAESILKASKFCMESPLACVAGVTGSDLKQRMVRIMTQTGKSNLGSGSKVLLSALGIVVIAAPVLTGAFTHRVVQAAVDANIAVGAAPLQKATIRPSRATETTNRGLKFHNGDLTYANVTVKQLILYAYGLKDYQLTSTPAWANTERYDVAATWQPSSKVLAADVAAPSHPPPPPGSMVQPPLAPFEPMVPLEHGQLELIIKSVLATRFGLQVNSELKDLPGFAMAVVPGGTRVPKPIAPNLASDGEQIFTVREASNDGVQEVGTVGPLNNFADELSGKLGAPVADRTGLAGTYDVTLQWTAGDNVPAAIGRALEQQLGLEIVPVSTRVQMLNVEAVKPPSLD